MSRGNMQWLLVEATRANFQKRGAMIERFDKHEEEYLRWVHSNPTGYVVNLDRLGSRPEYPMVHRASHKQISSPSRANYTTGDYFKLCSLELQELEKWSVESMGRKLVRCAVCMK